MKFSITKKETHQFLMKIFNSNRIEFFFLAKWIKLTIILHIEFLVCFFLLKQKFAAQQIRSRTMRSRNLSKMYFICMYYTLI